MKAKFKSPDFLKEKGQDFNIKLLKQAVKGDFSAPLKFFYDTEFDFGEEKAPLMYIGAGVPSPWKAYIKEQKKSASFVAGQCTLDPEGNLQLLAEIGKGQKPAVLKALNKTILKKCKLQAYFVDSIEQAAAAGAAVAAASPETTIEDNSLALRLAALIENGQELIKTINPVIAELEQPLQDIRSTVITDALIQTVQSGLKVINTVNLTAYLANAQAALAEAQEEAEVQELNKVVAEIKAKQPILTQIAANSAKVDKVKDPMDSDFAPISDDPFRTFLGLL
ncbi:hypothetical protein PPO43_10310 [Saprospira sp. CCB-QB6]|uniref:hypothetical protein n=1 Tax=Saprospira sp. CCB-QB6 TaxID=3023936 RepID=UPI00234A92B4|nr:hypothetical protein [Saprospira sp. CCB-QB6]WCL80367.1 hypothetical protein PPO43_10310 [Saprospira sp. CCB-QB6]